MFIKWILKTILGKKCCWSRQTQQEIEQKSSISQYKDVDMNEKDKKETIRENGKEKRLKEWQVMKDQILQKYQIPIADDAKYIAEELFGKSMDTLSVFFLTDERVIKQRYLEGGDNAIEEYAKNLTEYGFAGGPITFTLLKRLNVLKQVKNDGDVIDTEIDIDGFIPNGRIQYTIKEIDLDGQKIPSRRKFSPRCEMMTTITEGFNVGPFVVYDELYFCKKEEMEQMIEKEKDEMGNKENSNIGMGNKENKTKMEGICPHGSLENLYCNQCDGDIIVSPSKKKVIAILLDVTGSMSGKKIRRAQEAVKNVLEKIPVDSNIDIVLTVFSTRFKEYYKDIIPYGIEFSPEIKEMALEKVSRLEAEGNTPLYEVINRFLDETWNHGFLDKDKIFFPYTYLIIVSDGEENYSTLKNLIYRGKRNKYAFFSKIKAYRDSGLITEIIPFAYGEGPVKDLNLVRLLKNISGKMLINETDPDRIIKELTSTVDSILYGSDNLKMMGIPVSELEREKKTSVMRKNNM